MRKSWIRKDQSGVSPVIATILMVAITVVLAAVLYLMVSNFGGDDTEVLSGTITVSEDTSTVAEARFGKFSSTTTALSVDITIESDNGTSTYNYDDTNGYWETDTDNAGTGLTLVFTDLGGDGNINNGDYFKFTIWQGNEYDVMVIVGGDEVCSDTLTT